MDGITRSQIERDVSEWVHSRWHGSRRKKGHELKTNNGNNVIDDQHLNVSTWILQARPSLLCAWVK